MHSQTIASKLNRSCSMNMFHLANFSFEPREISRTSSGVSNPAWKIWPSCVFSKARFAAFGPVTAAALETHEAAPRLC